ncbi:MAG: zinc ribbon domain-containing protein [Vicinamibacteraceae bacterium]
MTGDDGFPELPGAKWPAIAGRALLWLILAWLTLRFAAHSIVSNYAGSSWLHLINLVFHEAGHVLFGFFPRFFMVLGGSATQVLVPLACLVAFVRQGDRFGAAVAVWWAGQNLVDLAPYINDARDLQLVLLGGRTGAEVEGHDWEYLLGAVRLMTWDHALARLAHVVGLLIMMAALAWAVRELLRQYHDARAEAAA